MLNKLLELQSSKDGLERAPIGNFSVYEDDLSKAVQETAMFIFAARESMPLMEKLALHGRELEAKGLIKVEYGESVSVAALAHLVEN